MSQVPYKALRANCNLWRNWVDIQDSWESLASILTFWAKESLHNKQFQAIAGAGAWNDPDMLIIGNRVMVVFLAYPTGQCCSSRPALPELNHFPAKVILMAIPRSFGQLDLLTVDVGSIL